MCLGSRKKSEKSSAILENPCVSPLKPSVRANEREKILILVRLSCSASASRRKTLSIRTGTLAWRCTARRVCRYLCANFVLSRRCSGASLERDCTCTNTLSRTFFSLFLQMGIFQEQRTSLYISEIIRRFTALQTWTLKISFCNIFSPSRSSLACQVTIEGREKSHLKTEKLSTESDEEKTEL